MLKKSLALLLLAMLMQVTPALAEEVSNQYFTVNVPEGWKAVPAPQQAQGLVSAIFAKASGGVSVTIVVGPNSGNDAKTIATAFAQQFGAPKPPVEKNGQYSFAFTQQGVSCQAYVSAQNDIFMVISLAGNPKEGMEFLKKNAKAVGAYTNLLPK